MVAVLDKRKKPLSPCSEKRARKILEQGRARVHKIFPVFTIRMVDREVAISTVEPLVVLNDPGSKKTGVAVVRIKDRIRQEILLWPLYQNS